MRHRILPLALSAAAMLVAASSCNDSDNTPDNPIKGPFDPTKVGHEVVTAGGRENLDGQPFYLGYAVGYTASKQTFYLHYADKLDDPNTVIEGGKDAFALVTNERAPHAYISGDGNIYSLTYRVGDITKVSYDKGTKTFSKSAPTKSDVVIGNNNMRFTLLNGTTYSSVHEVSLERISEGDKVVALGAKYNIALLDNKEMKLSENHTGTIRMPNGMDAEGYFVNRLHSPVITGGKIYYGASITKYPTVDYTPKKGDKLTGDEVTATVVMDYPSFANPTVIVHPEALGSTTGYRTRNMFLAEDGKTIYQLTGWGGGKAAMLTLRDGKYTGAKVDLGAALGQSTTRTVGWFYAGDGIAYVPYAKGDADPITTSTDPNGVEKKDAPWGIARVDIKSGKVVDLEVPANIYLQQFQDAAIRGGKIYFPLTPAGAGLSSYDGRVYIWDVKSTNPKPTLGAVLKGGSGNLYTAIY